MSKVGIFRIPGEFKSEDRWLRYFTRKQMAVLVVCGIIDYRLFMAANEGGFLVPAIIVMILFTAAVMGSVMIHLPVDAFFLSGGGLTIDELLFRLLYRRLHRELYVKNYGDRDEEEL